MSEPTVLVHRRGAAATIELHRPATMNAWNSAFGDDLLAAIQEVEADASVRAVCVTGAGKAFSSGVDLRELPTDAPQTADGRPDIRRLLEERYHPIITGLRTMPKPVVAAVNGPAVGIGLSLALAADLVVARRSAYFLLAFVNIGLVPDGGSSLFVPSRIGFARAAELALLGDRLDAEQAVAWGLINRAFADETFDEEVTALVDRLAAGPTRAYAGVKQTLNAWLYEGMDAQLEREATAQQSASLTPDFDEGVAAFRDKRRPAFTGA